MEHLIIACISVPVNSKMCLQSWQVPWLVCAPDAMPFCPICRNPLGEMKGSIWQLQKHVQVKKKLPLDGLKWHQFKTKKQSVSLKGELVQSLYQQSPPADVHLPRISLQKSFQCTLTLRGEQMSTNLIRPFPEVREDDWWQDKTLPCRSWEIIQQLHRHQ